MKKISFINYSLAIAIITVISGIIYATVQQTYRSGANDPQIQIARDINSNFQQAYLVEGLNLCPGQFVIGDHWRQNDIPVELPHK